MALRIARLLGLYGQIALRLVLFLAFFSMIGLAGPAFSQTEQSKSNGDKVRIVFVGDVMLDGGPGHAVSTGVDPFHDVAQILAQSELAVCNLECTVAAEGDRFDKTYNFQAQPRTIPVLKEHFGAVCLANNHSCDYGHKGFLEELASLEKAGLPYFGGGRNAKDAHRPMIFERNGLRVALLGFNNFPPQDFEAREGQPGTAWLTEAAVIDDIKAARSEHHADIVVPFLHWGCEMQPAPEDSQKALARRLIDAGADAIIGGHAHVIQTVDIYRGRPIIYSLGNFVFDYFPEDPPVWTGWIVRLTFSKNAPAELETFAVQIDPAGIPHMVPRPEGEKATGQ